MTNTRKPMYKGPSKAYDSKGTHVGPGEWLKVVHLCNRQEPGFFGSPEHGEIGGNPAELYPDARIIHLTYEEAVIITPTTEHGETVLRLALAQLDVENGLAELRSKS